MSCGKLNDLSVLDVGLARFVLLQVENCFRIPPHLANVADTSAVGVSSFFCERYGFQGFYVYPWPREQYALVLDVLFIKPARLSRVYQLSLST